MSVPYFKCCFWMVSVETSDTIPGRSRKTWTRNFLTIGLIQSSILNNLKKTNIGLSKHSCWKTAHKIRNPIKKLFFFSNSKICSLKCLQYIEPKLETLHYPTCDFYSTIRFYHTAKLKIENDWKIHRAIWFFHEYENDGKSSYWGNEGSCSKWQRFYRNPIKFIRKQPRTAKLL